MNLYFQGSAPWYGRQPETTGSEGSAGGGATDAGLVACVAVRSAAESGAPFVTPLLRCR